MRKLCLIDDDTKLGSLLQRFFAQHQFELILADHPAAGFAVVRERAPELVILDVMLPGMTGFEVCKQIRHFSEVPILMLSARGEVTDRIVGLELGADDYLPKPFEPRELLARVQTILRRRPSEATATTGEILSFEGLSLNCTRREALLDGKPLELSTMEFEMLKVFALAPGRVLTRDECLDRLRGQESVSIDRSIDVLISRLRQKLGENPKAPRFFRTVRGSGYVFIAKAVAHPRVA